MILVFEECVDECDDLTPRHFDELVALANERGGKLKEIKNGVVYELWRDMSDWAGGFYVLHQKPFLPDCVVDSICNLSIGDFCTHEKYSFINGFSDSVYVTYWIRL